MYKTIAKRKARGIFAALSRGDWRGDARDVADDVHHVFPGDNAFGGERHSREGLEVVRAPLPPDPRARVRGQRGRRARLAVGHGGRGRVVRPRPSRRRRALRERGRPLDPPARGKATYIHAYLDTEKVTAITDRLAARLRGGGGGADLGLALQVALGRFRVVGALATLVAGYAFEGERAVCLDFGGG